ncbi:MAG TPA: DNA mismatch repair endonuclease MutL [Desulfobacteraceae bacterium]|nr:DNA mismatch repair endonuclease MutL [Desulfobacteraceae bacterium]
MADVRVLSEIVSNKIAAGEVVERPVSVVKELVENALDAGATRITAEIEKGGRSLVRVSDNGSGMSRDNALLAIERYATSKIATDQDLFAINSFGFRGEALPSMASVAKLTLVTREKDATTGTRIHIKGGALMDVSDVGAPAGTMIEVRDLYFNTPARRKFLKAVTTEMGHIVDSFSGMALGNPGVGFRLLHNGRVVKSFSASDDARERAVEVLGRESDGSLCRVDHGEKRVTVSGYVSHPSLTRSSSQRIKLFVNNRMVTDRGVVAAIFRGYKGRIMKGRFPLGVLFVSIPFDEVDVNVHPAKLEVRFADAGTVYSAVTRGVEAALAAGENLTNRDLPGTGASALAKASENKVDPSLFQWGRKTAVAEEEGVFEPPPEPPAPAAAPAHKIPDPAGQGSFPEAGRSAGGDRESVPGDDTPPVLEGEPFLEKKPPAGFDDLSLEEIGGDQTSLFPSAEDASGAAFPGETGHPEPSMPGSPDPGENTVEADHRPQLLFHVIGQVFGTYVVAQSDDGLFLVDQHAAHERIVYERLKKRAAAFRPPSQGLVVPETIEFSFREADLVQRILPDLLALGMEIEPFGGATFIVKSVPAIIDHREIKPLIVEMVDKITESGLDADDDDHKEQWLDEVLTLMACHSAIRANQPLNQEEMETLLQDLEACDNPHHCPHGRPTRITWSRWEMEKLFKRVV